MAAFEPWHVQMARLRDRRAMSVTRQHCLESALLKCSQQQMQLDLGRLGGHGKQVNKQETGCRVQVAAMP